jgi:hypothetical protein
MNLTPFLLALTLLFTLAHAGSKEKKNAKCPTGQPKCYDAPGSDSCAGDSVTRNHPP